MCKKYDDWCEQEKRTCKNCYYEVLNMKKLILIFIGKKRDFKLNNFIVKE